MSQFYAWLRSACCDAKIFNGLFNIERLDECFSCGNKVDVDDDCYDARIRAAENFFERHGNELYGVELQDVIDHHIREGIDR